MSSPAAIVCREVFDENSQPSAEEVSEYAQQLGIDPDSESHLLPLARDGLMQALPAPWKAYFDEKLQTHYYYNDETKKTQWEHPLDHVYRELVRKARDASAMDDTCASVQELLTSEENTKNLERVETKAESDEDLSTDSAEHPSDVKDSTLMPGRRLAPLGRPPLAPLGRLDKKLGELRISPLRRSAESSVSPKPSLFRNTSDRELLSRPTSFKTDIIDLKMSILSPEEEKYNPLLAAAKVEKGLPLPLSGRGTMFLKLKSELPSPDTDKSLTIESVTKSDPPKGILREGKPELSRKAESAVFGRHAASLDDDRKSVRFKLETLPDPTISPSSNSSSEQNEGSIISNPLVPPVPPSPARPAPLAARPPLPPRPNVDSPRSDKDSLAESETRDSRGASPRRRLLRPPAADYIKQDLFQKNFQKIADLVRSTDIEPSANSVGSANSLEEPSGEKEVRPRSPMIPQKNKISINLMESIESETSIDSPDREFANLDLNDLDDSNDQKEDVSEKEDKKDIVKEDLSEHSTNSKQSKSPRIIDNIPMPNIKVPKLDFFRSPKSEFKEFKNDESKTNSRSDSVDLKSPQLKSRSDSLEAPLKSPQLKVAPSIPDRSPRDLNKPWSGLSFKPKPVASPLKSSDSANSLGKSLTSPRLDGVILSQGKSSTDNVVVVYQFEQEDSFPKIKSPLPDPGKEMIERSKGDERRRLDLSLQKEIETIRMEWVGKEKRLKAELQEELKEAEEKFLAEKKSRLEEQAERHKREMEEVLAAAEENHQKAVEEHAKALQERIVNDTEAAEREHQAAMEKLREQYRNKLREQQRELEIENERALSELREQLSTNLHRERASMMEENRATIDSLRDEHSNRVAELRHDYRAEVERIRTQHACHLEELRGRLASDRLAPTLPDKYRCLKEKYARLKHDVKMSIERRNKRREMSMTTGSETEKSNSHRANQSLERCKELNETSVSAVIESEPTRVNNNLVVRNNDNDSCSENNANNNDHCKHSVPSADTPAPPKPGPRRGAVAFREPPRRRRDHFFTATTDFQDSSDATTADDKPKEPINGHGRRRCFTRLKSASTSRLNYSPKRGEGWSSPLESLRQQLRKLDDLEDQFPDLACQPAYSLRYPFAELGAVATADTPELEFVRHRALIEREGMRRARAVLKRRRAALKQTRSEREPHRAPSEERESTELEVALHRARALLGEKEIRLRHIERALRALAARPPVAVQETSSSGSSASSAAAGGAVLRSLRALHADVRDIWRALDARDPRVPAITASPESSSCNAPTTSHTRMTLSAPEQSLQDNSDGVAERARGLRAWLQTAP
ncbi:centrosomal protein of 164 kDa [Cydia pomonella]|uniref:centrosomal protein of 164 kDa n=1 Tax=Cydia pomonella TaxID=82600 RepID=UPI002ADD83EB|nr:centrosomal protein of 164 kDa [Cydia pomonella]